MILHDITIHNRYFWIYSACLHVLFCVFWYVFIFYISGWERDQSLCLSIGVALNLCTAIIRSRSRSDIPAWLFQCLFASRPSWDDDAQLTRLIEKGGAPQADFCWWLPNKYLCDTPNVSQCHKPPCWPTIPGGLGSFHNPKRIKRGIRYTQWSKPVGVAIFLGLLLFFLTRTFIFYVFDKWSVLKERGLRPRIADVGSIHRRNCYDVFLFLPMFMFM